MTLYRIYVEQPKGGCSTAEMIRVINFIRLEFPKFNVKLLPISRLDRMITNKEKVDGIRRNPELQPLKKLRRRRVNPHLVPYAGQED